MYKVKLRTEQSFPRGLLVFNTVEPLVHVRDHSKCNAKVVAYEKLATGVGGGGVLTQFESCEPVTISMHKAA